MSVALDDPAANLSRVPGVNDVVEAGGRTVFTVADADFGSVLADLARWKPRALVSSPPSLEVLFLRHYGTELAAGGVKVP